MVRQIKSIIIHCSATPNGQHVSVEDLDVLHHKDGLKRSNKYRHLQNPHLGSIDYHFVIYISGYVARGRHIEENSAHTKGGNSRSINICLVGIDKYTLAQWKNLERYVCKLATDVVRRQGFNEIPCLLGYRDQPNPENACPGFSVSDWIKNHMRPLPGHVLDKSEIRWFKI